MKRLKILLLVIIFTFGIPLSIFGGMVTKDQGLIVANNWIDFIIQNEGGWGNAPTANITEILEFRRDDRTLGYFCDVEPKGFVVISLLKELTPVKAYSTTSDIDPNMDGGLTELLKDCMERLLIPVENELGSLETANQSDLEVMLGTDQHRAWDDIQYGVDMNYQEGDTLVSARWHQGDPYNTFCPAPPTGDDCTDPRCLVGCVATAGAQVIHYWKWPPYGTSGCWADSYDWPHMPNHINTGSPQVQIDAIAELCYEVGFGVGMDYCDGTGCQSGAYTFNMENVYETWYRYDTACDRVNRSTMSQVGWFSNIQYQIDRNRPIQYKVEGHSIVCDGWREIGSTPIRQYHMNYGWANSATTWYTLDSLIFGGIDEEYMLVNIYPNTSMGNTLSGTYNTSSFPYRYFDQDAEGWYTTFTSGQMLQFLPGISVTCASGSGNYVKFVGVSSLNTRMYTNGDISKGTRLYNGGIKLHPGGSISFH